MIFKGPGNSAPKEFFYQLKEGGIFPISLPSINTFVFSARARTAITMAAVWKAEYTKLEVFRASDNIFFSTDFHRLVFEFARLDFEADL